ncbi:MAG: YMGG-like glycine zipper-containing protein [Candidatus Zapsychrus exili]|nr:YMGG-like glycine zipper-containing protein [Candidatus Zapsychrus exili]
MKRSIMLILISMVLMGCTATQKSTTAGTAIGAGLGAIIGHQSGNRDKGAAIGAAVGALGGYAVGENMKAKFCPTCGKDFDESVQFCPLDGTELKYKNK